jgi:hypothetical protein
MIRILGLLALALTACASAEQKAEPEKKWDVKVTTKGEAKIWVYRLDGSVQCEENSEVLTPAAASQELKRAGVVVFQSRTGHDGMMRIAVCGAPTGNTVELEIAEADLPKAQARGFQRTGSPN